MEKDNGILAKLRQVETVTWVVVALTCATFLLLVVAMLIPPRGQIHPSVLQGAAIITANVALIIFAQAVASGKTATFKHGNTTAVVGGTTKDEQDED